MKMFQTGFSLTLQQQTDKTTPRHSNQTEKNENVDLMHLQASFIKPQLRHSKIKKIILILFLTQEIEIYATHGVEWIRA